MSHVISNQKNIIKKFMLLEWKRMCKKSFLILNSKMTLSKMLSQNTYLEERSAIDL
jgi:hypothetical protein